MALLRWDQRYLLRADQPAHQGPRRKIECWQIIVAMVAHTLPFTGCIFAGLRLVGIDGTRWSVRNTSQHLTRIIKPRPAVATPPLPRST